MAADLFGAESKAEASLACCFKILQTVGILHARGYQRLRIFPYIRNNMWWRCDLAPADLFDPLNGACMENKPEHDEAGLIAHASSGNCCRPFGWRRNISKMPISRLADIFVTRFPMIARRSLGSDWAYAGWYQEMLMRTSVGALPVAYETDEYEQTVHQSLCLVPQGEGTAGEMPLPPLYCP